MRTVTVDSTPTSLSTSCSRDVAWPDTAASQNHAITKIGITETNTVPAHALRYNNVRANGESLGLGGSFGGNSRGPAAGTGGKGV